MSVTTVMLMSVMSVPSVPSVRLMVSVTAVISVLWAWVCRFSSSQIASWLVNDRRNRNGNEAQENEQLKKWYRKIVFISLIANYVFHHLYTTQNQFRRSQFYLQHFFKNLRETFNNRTVLYDLCSSARNPLLLYPKLNRFWEFVICAVSRVFG